MYIYFFKITNFLIYRKSTSSGMDAQITDKQELINDLVTRLERERNTLVTDIAAQERDVAGHSSAMTSRYDTLREEGQYKAAALRKRLMDLDQQLGLSRLFTPVTRRTDKVQGGSLVNLIQENGDEEHYLVLPFSPGTTVEFNDYTVTVVTPTSPAGQALIGATPNRRVCIGDTTYTVQRIE